MTVYIFFLFPPTMNTRALSDKELFMPRSSKPIMFPSDLLNCNGAEIGTSFKTVQYRVCFSTFGFFRCSKIMLLMSISKDIF